MERKQLKCRYIVEEVAGPDGEIRKILRWPQREEISTPSLGELIEAVAKEFPNIPYDSLKITYQPAGVMLVPMENDEIMERTIPLMFRIRVVAHREGG